MPIYTKNGDNGTSLIIGRNNVPKSDPVFEVLGTLDELNSLFGVILAETKFSQEAQLFLESTQQNLFKIGSLIGNFNTRLLDYDWLREHLIDLESKIDEMEVELPTLTKFILPGGCPQAAKIHLARSVCRRLERKIVIFYKNSGLNKENFVLMYINRLSDFLFTLARYINFKLNYEEKVWKN